MLGVYEDFSLFLHENTVANKSYLAYSLRLVTATEEILRSSWFFLRESTTVNGSFPAYSPRSVVVKGEGLSSPLLLYESTIVNVPFLAYSLRLVALIGKGLSSTSFLLDENTIVSGLFQAYYTVSLRGIALQSHF